jgi:hypothetical protein
MLAFAAAASMWTAAAPAPSREETAQEEDADADEEELGEGWIWLDAGAGYQGVDMVAFEADGSLLTGRLVSTAAGGPVLDLGAGVRLWFVTLGPRVRLAMFDAPNGDTFNLWSADLEAGFHVPLGRFEPHLTLAAGYSGFGGFDRLVDQLGDAYAIRGANVRAGLGLDVFVTEEIFLGADVTGEVLALNRAGVPLGDLLEARRVGTIDEAEQRILEADGTATGAAYSILGTVGFLF